MQDLISRQAAISAICNACGKIDCDKMDKCEKLQLPPANCSEFPNSSDSISRQAAIECLKTKIAEIFFKETAEKNVEKWLNELPTVQPEQKTGRWIDYCGDLHCSVCGFRNSDHYCLGEGIACPNCGAFMPDGLKNVLG